MTISEANQQLLFTLYHDYDNREAASIADWLMENLTGWQKIDRIINKQIRLSTSQETALRQFLEQLEMHVPVQYILHEAWFCGMKLYVDENVLIPRPETEELVEWIITSFPSDQIKVIDIGTGSGCIAIALKKKNRAMEVYACDISDAALEVARKNATAQEVEINFIQADILDAAQWGKLPSADLIGPCPARVPASRRVRTTNAHRARKQTGLGQNT